MRQTLIECAAKFIESLPTVALAALGGVVRMIAARREGQPCSWALIAIEIIVAGFAGFLVNALLTEFDATANIKVIGVSLAGFASREVLELMMRPALKMLSKFAEKINRENP